MAIRDALDRQAIEAAPPLPALVQFARVGRWLEQTRQRLAAAAGAQPALPSMSLVLIESRLWSRFSVDDGRLSLAPHVAGPNAGDVVVLTGEPVLKALLDGRLAAERAIAEGILIVIDASTSGDRVEEALRRAFDGSATGSSGAHKALH